MSNTADTFMYFSYGSNLLSERIHANNPTAVRKGIGKLKDYRLDFGYWSKRWHGSVATIVPEDKTITWGAIWELNVSDIPNLDRQEGVSDKIYEVITVDVETPEQEIVTCRSYQLCNLPTKIPEGDPIPENRKPSLLYLTVILKGAAESQLPENYVNRLKKIQHNNWTHSEIEKIMIIDN